MQQDGSNNEGRPRGRAKVAPNAYRRSSIYDIAARAGVSVSTVSRVLNGRIKGAWSNSAAKVQQIRAIADELNYRPDPLIRSLMGGGSRTIGLVGVSLKNPSEITRVRTIELAAREDGYQIYLASGSANVLQDSLKNLIEGLLDRRVDGMILMGRTHLPEAILSQLASMPAPCVFVGSVPSGHCGVEEQRGQAIDALLEHLAELGHRHVYYMASLHDIAHPYEKMDFYTQAASRHGVELIVDAKLAIDSTSGATPPAYQAMRQALEAYPHLTAVACCEDDAAIGAMAALREAGLSVPGDISVTGFNDALQAAYLHPALTTIRKPGGEAGHEGYELLKKLMEAGKDETIQPSQAYVQCETVIRASTGPVRKHQ